MEDTALTNKTHIGIVLTVLVLALAACSDSSSSSTAPSTSSPSSSPPPTPPGYPPGFPPAGFTLSNVTLSGVVFEETPNGRSPIEGPYVVHCELCSAETHTWGATDANGFYSFTGVWTDGRFPTRLWISKDGYVDPEGSGWRDVVVNGDTRFDVRLVRR
jgi:hypothetical protein